MSDQGDDAHPRKLPDPNTVQGLRALVAELAVLQLEGLRQVQMVIVELQRKVGTVSRPGEPVVRRTNQPASALDHAKHAIHTISHNINLIADVLIGLDDG